MDWPDRIGRRIRLRDLHILLAVAEHGSMARASTHLAISHPVVSKTIGDLEHTLGVRLFDRKPQGVELTAYGHALLKCGVTVFDEMRQGLKQIEFLTHPDSGELRIGCPEIVMAGLLPAILEKFVPRYPRIRLHVMHSNTAFLEFGQLRERNVELLIGRTPTPLLDDELQIETLFAEPFVAVASPNSGWARRRRIELAELLHEPWVLPPYDSAPGRLIFELFRQCGLEPPVPAMTTLSIQITATQVASGRFVGLLPILVANFGEERKQLKKLPVKLPAMYVPTNLITVKNRTLTPLAELFVACAREVTRPLANQAAVGANGEATM
jgi:DNA-binding transcriptional LysR family regulator